MRIPREVDGLKDILSPHGGGEKEGREEEERGGVGARGRNSGWEGRP